MTAISIHHTFYGILMPSTFYILIPEQNLDKQIWHLEKNQWVLLDFTFQITTYCNA